MIEEWKDIEGYEGLYQISSLWDIRNNRSKLKVRISGKWYFRINLYKNSLKITKTIHKLVAQAFIQNPENKPIINHKNWIKTDNRVENLEWCTVSHNNYESYRLWLSKIKKPMLWKFWKDHPRSKVVIQYSLEWVFIREWQNARHSERELLINNRHISECCNWRRKSAGWFIWRFNNVITCK